MGLDPETGGPEEGGVWGANPDHYLPPFVSPQCNVGWAGNGNVCGPDTDIDGYPDQALPCMDNNKHCKQVQGAGERTQGRAPRAGTERDSSIHFLSLTFRTTAF